MARAGTNVVVLLMMALAIWLFSSAVAAGQGKWFDRIYIIVFDKLKFNEAYGDPTFKKWAIRGRLLTNYTSVGYGAQSNYISMIAGRTHDIYNETSLNLAGFTLIDRLQPRFDAPVISWKAYLEDYEGVCNTADKIGKVRCDRTGISYVRAHNPFISFDSIRSRSERCKKIVPGTHLAEDASRNDVPEFNFYVPNNCHNGEGKKGSAGKHPEALMTTITDHAVSSSRTLVVVTFASLQGGQPGKVFTALIPLGEMRRSIPAGSLSETAFNHYSLLRTVEDNWDLETLKGKDVTAKNLFDDENSASM
jgi:acid phosphatase